jgi:two-component system, OmpR family, phosphate regulon sensor histidine kinase PhoR
MRKIRINFIVLLVTLAMVALLLIQFFQTAQLYDRKSTEFKASVETLLERIAVRHEKANDIRRYLHTVNKEFSGQYKDILKKEFQNLLAAQESVNIKDTTVFENGKVNNYLIIQGKAYDSISGLTTEQRVLAKDVRQLRQLFNNEAGIIPKGDSVSLAIQLDQKVLQQIFKKAKYINEMMIQAFRDNVYDDPAKRIDIEFLDSIIKYEIIHEGLPTNYNFTILNEYGESVKFPLTDVHYIDKIDTNKVASTQLFPGNVLDEQLYLYLDFPTRKSYLFREMGIPLLISLLLIILIVWAISFMFKTILTQKKLGEMKNDFISNMTHEFKTPISTISLACEALNDPSMTGGEIKTISPFVKMIDDENKRLGVLVERILQSAVIDRGELQLKKETLNFNEIIHRICENAKFRISAVEGELNENLPQETITIVGDRVHTTNLVSNLIDNAIKYSKERPNIDVILTKVGSKVQLSIKDQGIGISNEHIGKIFDKLYRVPTGNVHNVKGFGLGLSYVKAIVDLQAWDIQVKSKLGEGTEFVLTIIL